MEQKVFDSLQMDNRLDELEAAINEIDLPTKDEDEQNE